ncbi:beta-ketoacyl-ACP synthase II [Parapusillimonas granuli]|uniref:3-oxoacyl-[acyl-carrier-protein] synthase 2 n=1 Tax=Parapusillimonas granuli TaxID=380911 RepID=A0A853FZN6_9BURK|nr:3-oxoacyl-[acyl-carrier-protein] synthase II [Parapusillimonas granuli]MEB2400100.1 beta-ketoacyl-ACP synthase II [Alcaligenaceae bacterium]NYT51585.1 beta-ketoacyl-ACP synthase II [Parapusillimonas granuli]
MKRRVVITGLGIISPVGNDIPTAWDNIVNGRSGIGRITRFDPSALNAQIAGEVKGFDVTQYMSAKEAKTMDTFIHYGVAAGVQAWRDSGLEITEQNAERIGVVIGSGIGGLPRIEETQVEYLERGPRRISPFFVPASLINLISGQLSIMLGLKGPSYAVVSACTTGLHSIGDAARLIEYGDADVMVAGGAEATVSPLGVGGFAAMRALSTRNDDPTTASRPWDRDRDGFVLGEGAGVVVLEEYEHARKRGARIYGEFAGYGMSSDAHHITAPDRDGPRRGIVNALRNGGINPEEIDYVNAHGTSTPQGDKNETEALKLAFGPHASRLVVNSTKSMTGHLLGAAGGVEAVFTTLAVYNQVSPPTINIFNQDPECDLDYCANQARDMKIDVALSNSFGFGGTNGSMIVRRI